MRYGDDMLDEIKRRTDLVRLIESVGIKLKQRGREFVGLCPFHAERTPSFTVKPGGSPPFYHCFGCGEHGDAIGFVMRIKGGGFVNAVKLLAEDSGVELGAELSEEERKRLAQMRLDAEEAQARRDREATSQAREFWRQGVPAPGTLVETYLRGRGIDPDQLGGIPPTLRFHPSLRHDLGAAAAHPTDFFPAMVAAVQHGDRTLAAIHATFLTPAGDKIAGDSAKKMRGPVWTGAVRLTAPGEHMLIAEGIETALSVLQAMRRPVEVVATDDNGVVTGTRFLACRPGEFGVWAALSLGNIAGAGDEEFIGEDHPKPRRPGHKLPTVAPDMEHPGIGLPAIAKSVTICQDADNKDPPAAEALILRAAYRFERQSRTVKIASPPAGMDFNDLLRAKETA